MRALRTPDERFLHLSGYDVETPYDTVGPELRMHFVEPVPSDGPVAVMRAEELSQSYL